MNDAWGIFNDTPATVIVHRAARAIPDDNSLSRFPAIQTTNPFATETPSYPINSTNPPRVSSGRFSETSRSDRDPFVPPSSTGGLHYGNQMFRPSADPSFAPSFDAFLNASSGSSSTTMVPPRARFDAIYPGGHPSIDPSTTRQRIGPNHDEFRPPGGFGPSTF
jgi:hypothetical protein